MIELEGGARVLYQWDLNKRILIDDFLPGTRVEFSKKYDCKDSAVPVEAYEDGDHVVADVPNILLQAPGFIRVYVRPSAADTERTPWIKDFKVVKREMPEDYVYTETKTVSYDALAKRVADLEENGGGVNVSGAAVGQIIKISAVDENGKPTEWEAVDMPSGGGTSNAVQYVEQALTEEQQMQARKNLGLYNKRTVPEETEVYEYVYVGWYEGSGSLTHIDDGASYKISTPDADYECTSWASVNDTTGIGCAYIGNAKLISEEISENWHLMNTSNSIDCPFVLYQLFGGDDESLKVVLESGFSLSMGQAITFYKLGGMVDVVDPIPEEYLPASVKAGGYYTPSVTQPNSTSMQVGFTPSSEDMPAIDPVNVTLPAGPQGPIGNTGPAGPQGLQGEPGVIALSGAKVGQIARIAEVDENGVPTAWEAVEMASGDEWELIAEQEITTEDEVSLIEFDGLDEYNEALMMVYAPWNSVGNCTCISQINGVQVEKDLYNFQHGSSNYINTFHIKKIDSRTYMVEGVHSLWSDGAARYGNTCFLKGTYYNINSGISKIGYSLSTPLTTGGYGTPCFAKFYAR